MKVVGKDEIFPIITKNPRLNVRFWDLLEFTQAQLKCYIHKSAIVIISWGLGIFADDLEDLTTLLREIKLEGTYFLPGISYQFLPALQKYFPQIDIDANCDIWILDNRPFTCPELESLTINDAPLINENWAYRDDESISYIHHCIADYPSSVIRDDKGHPMAWALCYGSSPYHMNMGYLYVLPEYRRKGLATKITADLCSKVFDLGKQPLVHVEIENLASQGHLIKLGWIKKEHVFFGNVSFNT